MYGRLSTEVLKQHEATARTGHLRKTLTPDISKDRVDRLTVPGSRSSKMDKQHSDTGSMISQGTTGKLKFLRLRHKIKLFGGSFSKSGSESHVEKRYEPTYQLGPLDKTRFSAEKAEHVIRTTLEHYLKDKQYDPKKFPVLCKNLAELIKERIKDAGYTRYKLVAYVLVTENQGQSVRHGSRCLWHAENDNFATASYEADGFTAVGSVFATYFD